LQAEGRPSSIGAARRRVFLINVQAVRAACRREPAASVARCAFLDQRNLPAFAAAFDVAELIA